MSRLEDRSRVSPGNKEVNPTPLATDNNTVMDNVSNEYLRNAVLTASPEQLHLMLYDGAIRFTRAGLEGLRIQNWETAFNGFTRAQKIVLEMHNSLNYDVDRALCQRMASLYNFIYRKLVEASVERNPGIAEEVIGLLEYQRETWVMLMKKAQEEHAAVPSAPKNTRRTPPPQSPPQQVSESEQDSTYGSLSLHG